MVMHMYYASLNIIRKKWRQ